MNWFYFCFNRVRPWTSKGMAYYKVSKNALFQANASCANIIQGTQLFLVIHCFFSHGHWHTSTYNFITSSIAQREPILRIQSKPRFLSAVIRWAIPPGPTAAPDSLPCSCPNRHIWQAFLDQVEWLKAQSLKMLPPRRYFPRHSCQDCPSGHLNSCFLIKRWGAEHQDAPSHTIFVCPRKNHLGNSSFWAV